MPEALYDATTTAEIADAPPRTVLGLEGEGAPEAAAFRRAVAALRGVVFALKIARERTGRRDFKIAPLEAYWRTDDPALPLLHVPREHWRWRLRMAVPEDSSLACGSCRSGTWSTSPGCSHARWASC
jgi:hypothetical protein